MAAADAFEAFRLQVARTLELAHEQLDPVSHDRIRHAVRSRGESVRAMQMLVGSDAEHLGKLFLASLSDADGELTPEQVRELEQMIDDGLARADEESRHWQTFQRSVQSFVA